jgi:adenylosuccinate synthase
VSDFVGVPVKLVGVGPGRDQVIWADGEQPLRAVA